MSEDRTERINYRQDRLADYTQNEESERGGMDLPFAVLAIILLTIGVVMVLSASYARAYYDPEGVTGGRATYYFVRQTLFALAGVAAMMACARIPMFFYRRMSTIIMFVALALLVIVIPIGIVGGGARRWINLGFTTFQPSEAAKIAVILYFSARLSKGQDDLSTLKGLSHYLWLLGAVVLLLLLEPHVSAVMIIVAISLALLFVGGAHMKWFVGGGLGVAALFGAAFAFLPYVRERISAWLDPFADAADSGYQVVQSMYAIGSGGLLGLGLGNSRQKYLYLPEEHNDYIFSVVCEELGFIGAALILVLFALLVIRGYWLACHARDRFSCLVCVGITTLLALQVFLNVCVCTNMMPSTGISLPLFSYGGTALVIQMAEIGIVLSMSRDIVEKN